MNKCGGLWHNEDDLQRNTAELNEREKKDAIITQIKYRKVVLGTKVSDKKLLQITSNQKEYSLQELEDNLRAILRMLNSEKSTASTSSKYRQVGERKELINKYVTKKRKGVSTTIEGQQGKVQLLDQPELIGKHIYHKFIKDEVEEWIYGKVIKAMGSLHDKDCEFAVDNDDEDEICYMKLYEDVKNGDLVII